MGFGFGLGSEGDFFEELLGGVGFGGRFVTVLDGIVGFGRRVLCCEGAFLGIELFDKFLFVK